MTPQHSKSLCLTQFIICSCALFGSGCQGTSASRSDELEARLREKQATIERLSASLEAVESDRNIARQEASILRDELVKSASSSEVVQAAHALSRVDRIEVVPLLSGGLDRDGVPGDELVSILIAPKDADGEIHRVQGRLSLELKDTSLSSAEQTVATETFSESETEAIWHNGVVGRGFRVIVPIPAGLNGRNIVAQVRLLTMDGRQFDTVYQMVVSPQAAQ